MTHPDLLQQLPCLARARRGDAARRNGFSGDEVADCRAKQTFCRLVSPPNSDDV